MNEMVPIRSVKHYFNEFIVQNLKGKEKIRSEDLTIIKSQILDAFRKEVFGQIIFKFGPECAEMSTEDLADLNGVQNILQQAFRKWRRFCMLCGEYGLGSYFQLEDLKHILEDQTTAHIPDPEEVDVTGQIPEDTVIVDEKTLKPVTEEETTDGNENIQDT